MIGKFKGYVIPTIFVVAMMFVSCRPSVDSSIIDEAETIMERDNKPEDALAVLQSVSYDSITSAGDRARYGYLYARAMHKLDEPMDTDLYIRQSVDYYRSKGDSPELMRALFYYSNYLFENGLSESAVKSLMKSRQLTIKYGDDYWRAKAAELMALILSSTHNYQEAIKYNKEAIASYKKINKEINARYSYVDLAICYGNIFQFKRSLAITDSILQVAANECDSSLMAYCYKTKYESCFDMEDFYKAEESLYKYMDLSRYLPIVSRDFAYKAWILSKNGELDSALNVLENLSQNPHSLKLQGLIYQIYRDIYKAANNYKKANDYSDSLIQTVDRLSRISHSQLLVAAQRDYLDEDLKLAQLETARQRNLLIITAVIAVFVILSIILGYRYRLKVKKLDNEKKVNDIRTAYNGICSENRELEKKIKNQEATLNDMDNQLKGVEELRRKMENLYRSQWATLNSLCNEYFDKADSEKFRTYIFNHIETELDKFRTQASMNEIIKSIDQYLDCLGQKFLEQCTFLGERDRRFVIFIFAGFKPRAVCLFMGFKQKNYYAKKRNIINKIAGSDIPDRELFLRYLE